MMEDQHRGAAGARPTVSVVIPVLNAARFLEACVSSVLKAIDSTTRCDAELIFVDNGSTDGSVQMLRERWADRATILLRPGVKVGAVRNEGASVASGRIIAFVDADCVVGPDYLDRALEVLEETGASATGSTYALPPDPHWIERAWHRLHVTERSGPVKYLNAGNFVCRREAFEAVGGFDEHLTTGEDAELCMRMVEAGHAIHEDPSVRAEHLGNPKSLGHFFKKQRWHGLGMFGTFKRSWRDMPVLATFAHLVAVALALGLVVWQPRSGAALASALALLVVVPLLTVIFRGVRTRRLPPVLRGIVLYWLYFAARTEALLILIRGSGPGDHRG